MGLLRRRVYHRGGLKPAAWGARNDDRHGRESREMSSQVSGTEGYADEAEELSRRYESIPLADAHRAVLHLMPSAPSRVLDIVPGAGSEQTWFAAQCHRVVAVEPTDARRVPAMARHPSPHIEWLDDSLPELASLRTRGERFD